jgi:hypothetical protein
LGHLKISVQCSKAAMTKLRAGAATVSEDIPLSQDLVSHR